jgi:hypothetical protein
VRRQDSEPRDLPISPFSTPDGAVHTTFLNILLHMTKRGGGLHYVFSDERRKTNTLLAKKRSHPDHQCCARNVLDRVVHHLQLAPLHQFSVLRHFQTSVRGFNDMKIQFTTHDCKPDISLCDCKSDISFRVSILVTVNNLKNSTES